jgi:hypothetical protein
LLATELDGKRLEILIEIVPGARRIAALADANTTAPRELQALQDAAQGRGIELSIHRIAKPEEISGAMDASQAAGAQGFNVLASPLLFARISLAYKTRAHARAENRQFSSVFRESLQERIRGLRNP